MKSPTSWRCRRAPSSPGLPTVSPPCDNRSGRTARCRPPRSCHTTRALIRKEQSMIEPTDLDKVRATALERMERAERSYKIGKVFLITFEATLLACMLLTMDYRDRLHWLLLFTALLVYGIWLGGILTLGSYIRYSTQGILKAIDALRHSKEGS